MVFRSVIAAFSLLLIHHAASAAVLLVGPGQAFSQPSQAVAKAQDGDTIRIEPGTYYDCALVRQNNLTIEGAGPGVVLTDKTCRGKAILITNGNDITIRNLTLQRARVPDRNGAGIRAQGGNLTIEHTRFLDNEDGILSAKNPKATIRITDSEFIGNGFCDKICGHGIYINHVGLLQIENSRFFKTHAGHSIKSRAARTVVINSEIADGPEGTSSYAIDAPNGGSVLVQGNHIEKGPHAQNRAFAISIGEGGVNEPTPSIIIKDNVFTNDTGGRTTFVRNVTATPAELSGNVFKGGAVVALVGEGAAQ